MGKKSLLPVPGTVVKRRLLGCGLTLERTFCLMASTVAINQLSHVRFCGILTHASSLTQVPICSPMHSCRFFGKDIKEIDAPAKSLSNLLGLRDCAVNRVLLLRLVHQSATTSTGEPITRRV
jgi:hypothetical protein